MSFEIRIENKRRSGLYVYNLDGSRLASLAPKDTWRCATEDPYQPLARYDRIVFTAEGGVELSIRPGWTEPERAWPVTLLVMNGPAVEYRHFHGEVLALMKNIPYIADCDPHDEWAIYDAILLNVEEQKRVESTEHPGVYEFFPVLVDHPTLRSEAELDRLQKTIEALAPPIPDVPVSAPDEAAIDRVADVPKAADGFPTAHQAQLTSRPL